MTNYFVSIRLILMGMIPLVMLLAACDNENLTPGPELGEGLQYLNYDDDNLSAPELPGGNFYEAAMRVSAAEMAAYKGDNLVAVSYFISQAPQTASVRIYQGGDDEGPGQLLYEADITGDLRSNQWLTHELTQSLVMPESEFWIAVRFSHNDAQRTLGCDPGPAETNGDWLFDSTDNGWIPLSERTNGEISINWNVRGVVQPQ